MLDCVSGKNKLIAGFPTEIKFGHKTGRSNRTADGIQISEGDAGVIYLPNGEKCYIVVLIKDLSLIHISNSPRGNVRNCILKTRADHTSP